jgi:transglutaminase-like putative cysteine protease
MPPLRSAGRNALWLCTYIALLASVCYAGTGIGFQPVNSAELSMTSEPAAPGTAAICLYRQVDRDDGGGGYEDRYFRIKILTDEGRKFADIEIPFFKGFYEVGDLHARSIAPDGTITNYENKPIEKTIIKAKGVRYLAEVLTLANVQKGSLVEYYYRINFRRDDYIYDSHWILSDDLFTKEAHFSLKSYNPRYGKITLHWSWRGLPPGTTPPAEGSDKIIRLVVHNIPAFKTEDFMPPENELKSRVDFIYTYLDPINDQSKFWSEIGKIRYEWVNNFIGKRGSLQPAVAQIVSPTDDSQTKLRKLYAKVQELRNTDYEYEATQQEQKRQNLKPNKNAEDVWKHGGGDHSDLTWLYLALVRDAGFEAYAINASDREYYFFEPSQLDYNRVDQGLVLVKLNGKDV